MFLPKEFFNTVLFKLFALNAERMEWGHKSFDFCLGGSSVEFCYSQYNEPSSSRNLGQATHF